MTKKNELRKYLKVPKLKKNRILYELAYDSKLNIKKDKLDKLINYVKVNYIENNDTSDKSFYKKNLTNDLITFKSFKNYLELDLDTLNYATTYLSIYIAIIAVMFSTVLEEKSPLYLKLVNLGIVIFGKLEQTNEISVGNIFKGVVLTISLILLIKLFYDRALKWSTPKRLIVVNSIIYILEEINDNLTDGDEITNQEEQKDEDQSSETEDSIEITKPEDISKDTDNNTAIENETTKVEIADYSIKSNINFVKDASFIAVLLLSIAKVFGKKKKRLIGKRR